MIRLVLAAAIALAWSQPSHASRLPWWGFYMMHLKHKTDRRLARAIEWAREGADAGRPVAGVVVVWPHHVGEIRGGPNARGRWLVHSGNDGNAVRTRWRLLLGAIAFRWVR
jgi:hypothetical protein